MTEMNVIGPFLDKLGIDARARVIAAPLRKAGFDSGDSPTGCLIQVALGVRNSREWHALFGRGPLPWAVAYRYDDLVNRVGQGEANRIVRERAIAGGEAPVENRPVQHLESVSR